MITHASGESAARYEANHIEGFIGCTAVVLEAKSEETLREYARYLKARGLEYIEVHESSGTYAGQFMAIGLVPYDRELVAPMMGSFQCLKTLDMLIDKPVVTA